MTARGPDLQAGVSNLPMVWSPYCQGTRSITDTLTEVRGRHTPTSPPVSMGVFDIDDLAEGQAPPYPRMG
jgi:hypothetical protein